MLRKELFQSVKHYLGVDVWHVFIECTLTKALCSLQGI